MTSANKVSVPHPFPGLGNNLRHRYDEAFIRNEVTNLREQVTVLHDTLGDFISKIDKRLAGQDEIQRKLGSRITHLERLLKFKSPKKSSSTIAASPAKSPKQTRDTPSNVDGGEPGTSEPEPAAATNSYRILDVHGNEFVAIRYGEGTEEEDDGTNAVLISAGLRAVNEIEEEAVKEDGSDVDVDGDGDAAEESEDLIESETAANLQTRSGSSSAHANLRSKASKLKSLDWDQLEAESKTMIGLPERKGKGGKVSGRLGAGSPAWTHYLRTAIRRSLGDQAMLRYAREGSRIFKVEQEDIFAKIKDRVIDFCTRYDIHPPEEKLMDEIACAFLRNKKRYRAKI